MAKKANLDPKTKMKIPRLDEKKRKKVSQWGHPCYQRSPFLESK